MRLPLLLFILMLLLCTGTPEVRAQLLPSSATPLGVVVAFLNETASDVDSIDRNAFAPRFTGELGRIDPEDFRGLVGSQWKFRIDSIPNLVNIDEEDSLRRTVAYVTLTNERQKENWYIFCAGDSIWRIESMVRFPEQRTLLLTTIASTDTSPSYQARRAELARSLMPDDSICRILQDNIKDMQRLVVPLSQGKRWSSFTLRDIDFNSLEEYRELDDDIPESDMIFYSMDRGAMERLKKTIGLRRVERDARYSDAIFFVIADLGNERLGYVFSPSPEKLPPVSRNEFVTLKPATGGWWMFKCKARDKATSGK